MARVGFPLVFAIALALGTPASAERFRVGDTYECPSKKGLPAVVVWFGKVDDADTLGMPGGPQVASLGLWSKEGSTLKVGHMPFALPSLTGCVPASHRVDAGTKRRFKEGYETWRRALAKGGAGVFTITPAAAYWMAVGVAYGVAAAGTDREEVQP